VLQPEHSVETDLFRALSTEYAHAANVLDTHTKTLHIQMRVFMPALALVDFLEAERLPPANAASLRWLEEFAHYYVRESRATLRARVERWQQQ
jgi:hypothetical protein